MATCTDAERKLIDAMVNGGGVRDEVAAVVMERITPELRERAVRAHFGKLRAQAEHEAVWVILGEVGVRGRDLIASVWDALDAEAEARLKNEPKAKLFEVMDRPSIDESSLHVAKEHK